MKKLRVFSTACRETLTKRDSSYPFNKYHILPLYLLSSKTLVHDQIITEINPATKQDLCLAHSEKYVDSYLNGTISELELRRIGVKWSQDAVQRAIYVIGATCQAAQEAFENGASANLAGGQHHAHYDFGSGYSVFNDIVIGAEKLVKNNKIKNWLSLDLDVHQGDGTATITSSWPHVYTFSMHAKKVFPLRKAISSLDVNLESGMDDEEYLSLLDFHLKQLIAAIKNGKLRTDLIMYQAGVDIMAKDSLGCLNISLEGCRQRDEMVIDFARRCGNVPVCAALGGGYPNKNIDDVELSGMNRVVQAHSNTIKELIKYS
jgi:acetoin utilization deacetylase AcuC-like enzyme